MWKWLLFEFTAKKCADGHSIKDLNCDVQSFSYHKHEPRVTSKKIFLLKTKKGKLYLISGQLKGLKNKFSNDVSDVKRRSVFECNEIDKE